MLVFTHKETYSMNGETCRIILQKLKLDGWAIGRTKVPVLGYWFKFYSFKKSSFHQVFLKYYHIEQLSKILNKLLDAVILVQANARRWIARRRYLAYCKLRHHCATTIQKGTKLKRKIVHETKSDFIMILL